MDDKVDRYLRSLDRAQLEALRQKFPEEHFVALLKAALEVVPGIGGLLATLVDEYYPNRQMERVISFLEDWAHRLRSLETRVKTERINADDFGDLFFETLRLASREHQQEKLEAYRAILLNALVTADAVAGESEFFLSLVRELTGPHIQMLRVLYRPHVSIPKDVRFERQISEFEVSLRGILHTVFADAPDGFVDAVWTGLQVRGLVVDTSYRQKRRLSKMAHRGTMVDYTDMVLEQLPIALTPFGRRFIQYITEPADAGSSDEHSQSGLREPGDVGDGPAQQ